MINYDDLRKKAESLKELLDNRTLGAHNLNILESYHRSLPPDVILRLLRIIEVTKNGLRYYEKRPFAAIESKTARAILDEIAKIENE